MTNSKLEKNNIKKSKEFVFNHIKIIFFILFVFTMIPKVHACEIEKNLEGCSANTVGKSCTQSSGSIKGTCGHWGDGEVCVYACEANP